MQELPEKLRKFVIYAIDAEVARTCQLPHKDRALETN